MIAYPHTRRPAIAAAAVITLFALTSCDDGRPSVAEIEDQISQTGSEKMTEDQVACLAKTYYESGLSDDAVRLMVEAEDVSEISPDDLTEADQKASKDLYDPLVKCLMSAE